MRSSTEPYPACLSSLISFHVALKGTQNLGFFPLLGSGSPTSNPAPDLCWKNLYRYSTQTEQAIALRLHFNSLEFLSRCRRIGCPTCWIKNGIAGKNSAFWDLFIGVVLSPSMEAKNRQLLFLDRLAINHTSTICFDPSSFDQPGDESRFQHNQRTWKNQPGTRNLGPSRTILR